MIVIKCLNNTCVYIQLGNICAFNISIREVNSKLKYSLLLTVSKQSNEDSKYDLAYYKTFEEAKKTYDYVNSKLLKGDKIIDLTEQEDV